jgi:hypothetical protein
VALVAPAPAPASAEEAGVAAGTRVRLSTSKGRLVGTLVEQDGDTLLLAREKDAGAERLGIPLADVSRVEVSQGRHGRARGAKIGALIGLAAAVVIGVAGGESCSGDEMICFDHATTTAMGGVLTIPIGALVGAMVPPGEKWGPAPGRGLSVQPIVPRGGGVGVRLALAF